MIDLSTVIIKFRCWLDGAMEHRSYVAVLALWARQLPSHKVRFVIVGSRSRSTDARSIDQISSRISPGSLFLSIFCSAFILILFFRVDSYRTSFFISVTFILDESVCT